MPACHAGGRGFESRPDRKNAHLKGEHFYFVSALSSIVKTIQPQNLLKTQKSIAVERQKVSFNLKKGRSTGFGFCNFPVPLHLRYNFLGHGKETTISERSAECTAD
jgi:hypothetical protein